MNTKPEQTFGTAYRMSMTPLTELSHGEIIIVGAVLVGSDITDTESLALNLREAQEEHSRLAASESRAQDASRLKSEFVANVSSLPITFAGLQTKSFFSTLDVP